MWRFGSGTNKRAHDFIKKKASHWKVPVSFMGILILVFLLPNGDCLMALTQDS